MAAARASRNLLAAGVLVLAAPTATDDTTETTAGSDTTSGSSSPDTPADDFSIADALTQLPVGALGEQPMIIVGDLDAASELNGLERPTDATDPELRVWMSQLAGAMPDESDGEPVPVFVPLPPLLADQFEPAAFDEAVGWSVADVATVVATVSPPTGLTVVTGDFDDDTLPAGLAEVADGVVTDVEGEDFESTMEPTPMSRIGVPQRLAVNEGRIAVSPSTPAVEAWLAGGSETAADAPALAALANALDAAGAVTAVLIPMSGGVDLAGAVGGRLTPAAMEELLAELADVALTEPFDAVGIGWGVDDEGEAAITLAYHFGDDASASASLERIESLFADGVSVVTQRPLSDVIELDEVRAEGAVAVARLHPGEDGRPQFLFDALLQRDLPFVVI